MEKKQIRLKKKKKSFSIKGLFADKKKRYLFMFLFMLPFIIGIAVFGTITYREVKTIMNLAAGNVVQETKAENIIESMDYILRDNPTDIQKEYFAQLKSAVEEGNVDGQEVSDTDIVSLVAKNYIVDFYTWTNKRGQYDIGGLEFIYDGEFENGDHYKDNSFYKARDGFYKYVSAYAKEYGGYEKLIEVENVDVVSCQKMPDKYLISEHSRYEQGDDDEWYDVRENEPYDWYHVECRWTYKSDTSMNLSQFANSVNLAIIDNDGRYEIVEASENRINAGKGSEKTSADQTSTSAETSSETAE